MLKLLACAHSHLVVFNFWMLCAAFFVRTVVLSAGFLHRFQGLRSGICLKNFAWLAAAAIWCASLFTVQFLAQTRVHLNDWFAKFNVTYSISSNSLVAQLVFCAVSISSSDATTAPLATAWPTASMILVAVFWPLVAILVDEAVKRHDASRYAYYQRKLRLTFETKLGMYSPK